MPHRCLTPCSRRLLLLLPPAVALSGLSAVARSDPAPDAAQLGRWIHDAEHVLRGKTSASVMGMMIKKASFEREYDLLVMTDDRTENAKVLMRMLGPALWRGNATLKVGDRISFFDPRTSRVTVMGSSMLADSWMGSHFTNDDLLRETDLARHYRYETVSSRAVADDAEQPATEHLIRLTPLPDAPVAWGKVHYLLHVGRDGQVLPVQLDYYRRPADAQPARTLRYSELRTMDARRVPTRMTMTLADSPGEFTRIDYRKLKFDTPFGADQFSERAFR